MLNPTSARNVIHPSTTPSQSIHRPVVANSNPMPVRPKFTTQLQPGGMIKEPYQLTNEDVAFDTRAMDKFGETAIRDAGTDSEWAKQMLAKQAEEQGYRIDDTTKDSAGSEASAIANMMMYGGADASAMERVARESSRNSVMDRQGVRREGQLDRMNIGLQDEQDRMSQLGIMHNMGAQKWDADNANRNVRLDTSKYNIGNSLADVAAKRQFDMDTYKEQMGVKSAEKNAEAMKQANKGK